jgi:hypothetical protein
MPSLDDLARAFAAVSSIELLLGLLIAVALVVLFADWRVSLLALALQYVFVAILLSTLIPLQIATVRMIAGGLVALMLYITARRVYSRRRTSAPDDLIYEGSGRGVFWTNFPFRLIGLALIALSVVALSGQFVLLKAPLLFWITGLWLAMGGLLAIALTRDALRLGIGLLFFTSGFGILYLSIDNSLLIYALLVISDLIIALAVSHIASVPGQMLGSRRGEL